MHIIVIIFIIICNVTSPINIIPVFLPVNALLLVTVCYTHISMATASVTLTVTNYMGGFPYIVHWSMTLP